MDNDMQKNDGTDILEKAETEAVQPGAKRLSMKNIIVVLSVVALVGLSLLGLMAGGSSEEVEEQSTPVAQVEPVKEQPEELEDSEGPVQPSLDDLVSGIAQQTATEFSYAGEAEDIDAQVIVRDEELGKLIAVRENGAAFAVDNTNYDSSGAAQINTSDVNAESRQMAVFIEGQLSDAGLLLASPSKIAEVQSDEATLVARVKYEDADTICQVTYANNRATLHCIPKASIAIEREAIRPFYATQEEGYEGLITVTLQNAEQVGDSYERLSGAFLGVDEQNGVIDTTAGAAALFYREVSGEWQFFMGTQQIIDCTSYNTPVLQVVYAADGCYVEGGQGITVGEFYGE